jgi:hypothetical protein
MHPVQSAPALLSLHALQHLPAAITPLGFDEGVADTQEDGEGAG